MSEALERFIAENGGARITTDSVSIDDIETARVVEKKFADAKVFLAKKRRGQTEVRNPETLHSTSLRNPPRSA